jgi:hypothetical protein
MPAGPLRLGVLVQRDGRAWLSFRGDALEER